MNADMGCAQVRELAPELALGIAEGDERAAALRHLSGCAACRRLVSELSAVGDELLLLAPAAEPPPGFESRVLGRLAEPARPRAIRLPPWRRWAAVAAAAVLAAALGGGSVFLATAGDRRLADSYQAVLRQGQGSFFAAAPLQGPQGRAGTVFGYQGQPSWATVTLRPPIPAARRFRVQVLTRDGRYLAAGEAVLGGTQAAWGGQLPVDLSAVNELRLLGPDGRTTFTATFDTANPWD
jgi:hypothetical protein